MEAGMTSQSISAEPTLDMFSESTSLTSELCETVMEQIEIKLEGYADFSLNFGRAQKVYADTLMEEQERENGPMFPEPADPDEIVDRSSSSCMMETENVTGQALLRIGGKAAEQAVVLIAGGVFYEISDAFKHERSLSLMFRMKRIFGTAFAVLLRELKENGVRKIVAEIVSGLFGIVCEKFKNLKAFFKTVDRYLRKAAGKVIDYAEGRIRSLGEMAKAVLKILSAAGIAALALAAEEYLKVQFPMFSPLLIGLGAAAAGGVAMVFVNRLIDRSIGVLLGLISEAVEARRHREEVERYIADNLGALLDDTERINRYAQAYLDNLQSGHDRTFADIKASFAMESVTFLQKINAHAEAVGVRPIEDGYLDELDRELLDFADRKHGRK